MKNIFKIIFTLASLMILFGCEEVIEVELDNADPQIVIEANISDNPDNNIITITKSTDFYNPSEYDSVSGAEITVMEIGGNEIFTFTESSLGTYINHDLSAETGSEYEINVTYEGTTYSATSTQNTQLTIDSLIIRGKDRPFNDDELDYEYHIYFQDNLGIDDYARFKIYINGEVKDGIFLYEDRLTDGNYIDYFYFNFDDEEDEIQSGDRVTIELITIDKAIYNYFDTIKSALASSTSGPSGGTAPSNPTTNWDNDALGYFSVNSTETVTKRIR